MLTALIGAGLVFGAELTPLKTLCLHFIRGTDRKKMKNEVRGQRYMSVGKALAMKTLRTCAWSPEPTFKKPGAVAGVCNPRAREALHVDPWCIILAYFVQFQASERPCLKNQHGHHLRNDTRGCPLTSTHMQNHVH